MAFSSPYFAAAHANNFGVVKTAPPPSPSGTGLVKSLSTAALVSSYRRADFYRVTRLEVELDRFHPAEREDPDDKVQDPDEPGEGFRRSASDGRELALNVLPLDIVLWMARRR